MRNVQKTIKGATRHGTAGNVTVQVKKVKEMLAWAAVNRSSLVEEESQVERAIK
jgi:hypothetical protein